MTLNEYRALVAADIATYCPVTLDVFNELCAKSCEVDLPDREEARRRMIEDIVCHNGGGEGIMAIREDRAKVLDEGMT